MSSSLKTSLNVKENSLKGFTESLMLKSKILFEKTLASVQQDGITREIYVSCMGEVVKRTIRRAGRTLTVSNIIPGAAQFSGTEAIACYKARLVHGDIETREFYMIYL
jgi:hypothetical protein